MIKLAPNAMSTVELVKTALSIPGTILHTTII